MGETQNIDGKAVAKALREDLAAEVAGLGTRGLPEASTNAPGDLRTVHDRLAAWLERQERRPDLKPRSLESFRLACRHLVAWLGEVVLERVDRLTFGIGCGIAGIAGSAFTMIGSTGPTAGQLYIVDTFLVVVFGGAQSLFGTIASAFAISQSQSAMEFFLSGSMAKVLTLLTVVGILMLRPQGLFSLKIRR